MSEDSVLFKDFSDDRKPVLFSAQGERYEAFPALSIETVQELTLIANGIDESNILDGLDKFFSMVMDDDNLIRIKAQMRNKANPLTTTQAVDVMNWILEQYGLRPSQSSSD